MRIFMTLVGAIFATMLLIAGWFAYQFMGTGPQVAGSMKVEGADAPLRIVRDVHGVPHIFAQSEADAYFGLGFAQTQDRLFQMDLTRRLMQGRLAELVGSRALPVDRRNRILGWSETAKAQLAALPPEVRSTLEAYSRGVNAAIRSGVTSPEYAVLLASPESWRLEDTLAAALAMTNQLTSGEDLDIARRRLAAKLTPQQIDEFLAEYPDWAPRSFHPGELPFEAADAAPQKAAAIESDRPGSNNWVVSGARTGTGKPVLANDPHLGLAAPGPFYLAHLHWPKHDLVGATLPGAPFVVIGHNGRIAWGTTTHPVDAGDLLPAPAAVQTREELIRTRDWGGLVAKTEKLTVSYTPDGPVLTQPDFSLGGDPKEKRVLRTIADDPDNGLAAAVYAMSKADSVDGFFAATRSWVAPPQNLVVASVTGDIGLVSPGRFPLRDASGAWVGDIPFEGRLEAKNPKEGWFGTANNLMPPRDYPYPMPGGPDPYRITRITEVLEKDTAHSPDHARALQGDETSVQARRLQPLLAAATPGTAAGKQAQDELTKWNAVAGIEAHQPTLFAYWLQAIGPLVYGDELGPELAKQFQGPRNVFLDAVLTGPLGHWCDDVATKEVVETCAQQAGKALDQAAERIRADLGPEGEAWEWGKVHEAVFPNPVLSGLPMIGKYFTIHAPKGGDHGSVNVGREFFASGSFHTTHAAGLRMVANLADLNTTRFQVAPGESGHPASPHYGDLAPLWARNEGIEIRTDWAPDKPPPGARVLTLRTR